MKKYFFSACSFFLLLLVAISCNGQSGTISKDNKNIQLKLIKNHFITKYPGEFFFVQCGLQDKAGNMWFGSAGDGIYCYNQAAGGFINFTHSDGLCHNDILCCAEDKNGTIWFGTRNGLIRYKPSGEQPKRKDFSSFLISANVISNVTHQKIPYTYLPAENFIWSILPDKNGKVWFGTNKGVYVCNPLVTDSSGIPLFSALLDNDSLINKNGLQLKDVLSMAEDKDGNIWFASGYMKGEGICRYDGRSVVNFKPDSVSSFRSIVAGRNGKLFFLNVFKGVYSYDPVSGSFSNFSKQIGLQNDTIASMKEDKAGNFWFGGGSYTMENGGYGGVWRYDGESLKLFTTKDGLSHNCVTCIVEDRDKNIWFGTRNTGLCRFDGKSFTDFTDR
jgi:ligand-binding sensor domain-containing protein